MAAALLPDALWDLVKPFLSLGCALICWQVLREAWMTG